MLHIAGGLALQTYVPRDPKPLTDISPSNHHLSLTHHLAKLLVRCQITERDHPYRKSHEITDRGPTKSAWTTTKVRL